MRSRVLLAVLILLPEGIAFQAAAIEGFRSRAVPSLAKFKGAGAGAAIRRGGFRPRSRVALAPSSSSDDDNGAAAAPLSLVARYGVLLTVPVVWGTYAPAVRYLYSLEVPMPGLLFSAIYYVVAFSALLLATAVAPLLASPAADAPAAIGGEEGRAEEEAAEEDDEGESSSSSSSGDRSVWSCGAELGGYLYLGNFFQVIGLQYTTADRAAFIVQLTTILVPVLEATVFRTKGSSPLPLRTWLACLVALFGVVVISSDGLGQSLGDTAAGADAAAAAAASSSSSPAVFFAALEGLKGEGLVAVSALLYSLHVLRLGAVAPRTAPLELAVAKAGAETAYSLATLALLAAAAAAATAGGGSGRSGGTNWLEAHFPPAADVGAFWTAVDAGRVSNVEWGAIGTAGLWCGVMTCAYTIWAQSFGQTAVRPAQANLIYTSQPLFSAAFAELLLNEHLSAQGWLGGGIIVAALVLSLSGDEKDAGGGGDSGGVATPTVLTGGEEDAGS